MPASSPLTTRRTAVAGALAGAAGLAGLTGCDLEGGGKPQSSSSTPGAAVARSSEDGGPNPDEQLVDDLRAELASVLALVSEVRRHRPRLRPALDPLVRMHRTHLDVLAVTTATGRATPLGAASRRPAAARTLVRVRAREATTQQRLDEWALRARSGTLAQLLASMSASVAQHLAVLPGDGGGGSS